MNSRSSYFRKLMLGRLMSVAFCGKKMAYGLLPFHSNKSWLFIPETRLRLLFHMNDVIWIQRLPVVESLNAKRPSQAFTWRTVLLPCYWLLVCRDKLSSCRWNMVSLTIDLLMPLKAYTSGHLLSLTSLKRAGALIYFLLLVTWSRDRRRRRTFICGLQCFFVSPAAMSYVCFNKERIPPSYLLKYMYVIAGIFMLRWYRVVML